MLRVLIIAEDSLARVGLASLLKDQPGCTVTGQIASDVRWSEAAELYRPDVALFDLGVAPARTLERIDFRGAPFPVIALIPDATDAADAWAAGPHGLLLRETVAENLCAAIGAVAQGLLVFEPTLAVAAPRRRDPTSPRLVEDLTPRELDVLRLVAEGKSNKEIAHDLEISDHTVKFHLNAILGKLNASSRTEAVVIGTRLGLILL